MRGPAHAPFQAETCHGAVPLYVHCLAQNSVRIPERAINLAVSELFGSAESES